MAIEWTLTADRFAILREANRDANDHTSNAFTAHNEGDRLLLGFPEDGTHQFYDLAAGTLTLNFPNPYNGTVFELLPLAADWDAEQVTFNTKPAETGTSTASAFTGPTAAGTLAIPVSYVNLAVRAAGAARYGVAIMAYVIQDGLNEPITTPAGATKPTLTLRSENEEIVGLQIASGSPAGGYVSKHKAQLFTWQTKKTGNCQADVIATSTTFSWRGEGQSTWTDIPLAAGATYVSIPAETFAAFDSVEWKVTVVSNSGITAARTFTVVTTEPAGTARPLSPVNTMVDGSEDLTFTWDHVISTGTEPTGADLQTSTDGETWTDLDSVSGSETSYTVPAGTLTAGTAYWRVRTYNSDGVVGAWSEAAQLLVVAAPAAPAITVESMAPQFAIRWSGTGQQGYEVSVDGVTVAQAYGTEGNYTYSDWLSDGEHTVAVRIQNEYSLWSEWGTAGLTIENAGAGTVDLQVAVTHVVQLLWEATGAFDAFVVYRDGVRIGTTQQNQFEDAYSAGEHTWKVRGVFDSSGEYVDSNEVTDAPVVTTLMILDITDGSDWLRLDRADVQNRKIGISTTRSVSFVHYAGNTDPTAELAEAYDTTYQFEVAFTDPTEAAAFEAMVGHVVCVKDQYGTAMIGVLNNSILSAWWAMRAYQANVTKIEWNEEAQA